MTECAPRSGLCRDGATKLRRGCTLPRPSAADCSGRDLSHSRRRSFYHAGSVQHRSAAVCGSRGLPRDSRPPIPRRCSAHARLPPDSRSRARLTLDALGSRSARARGAWLHSAHARCARLWLDASTRATRPAHARRARLSPDARGGTQLMLDALGSRSTRSAALDSRSTRSTRSLSPGALGSGPTRSARARPVRLALDALGETTSRARRRRLCDADRIRIASLIARVVPTTPGLGKARASPGARQLAIRALDGAF